MIQNAGVAILLWTMLRSQKSEITCLNNVMNVDGKEFKVDHPGIYIKELLKRYRSPKIAGLPTFTGGLVGYFAL